MPQSPAFSITGGPIFADNVVNFTVIFADSGDSDAVQAYEWYLDGLLFIDAITGNFSANIGCGGHSIGVRLLGNGNWTGTQELSFYTCKTLASKAITGPANVMVGQSVAYSVIWTFTDVSSIDMSSLYIFTSTAGGTFSGNIFTATGDGSTDPSLSVTITADDGDGAPLSLDINILQPDADKAGLLVVDIYNDASLNVIGFINNSEVAYNHVAAYTGSNFVPARSDAGNALILASDQINQSSLQWRFIFNLAMLKTLYPATTTFTFILKGRSSAAGTINGGYNLKNEATTIVMNGTPGAYIPSVTGGSQLGEIQNYSAPVVGGANGSYLETNLTTIATFVYMVSTESVTYTPV